jgi:GNAT superfamily N-acetyltransferase
MPDPVPVVIIGRLAVDRRFQGRGIGSALLKDALRQASAIAQIAGTRAVMVHAIDDAATRFYLRLRFEEFPAGSRTLFLPIETIDAVAL